MDSDLQTDDGSWSPEPRLDIDTDSTLQKRQIDPIYDGHNDIQSAEISCGKHASLTRGDGLRSKHHERYLELYRETHQDQTPLLGRNHFLRSQMGAVVWEADEKVKFFEALPSCGRHDLQKLAHQVGTKSTIEVKAFLLLLQEGLVERQLFERQTNNFSRTDILAAVEIGADLDAELEKYADALSAYEDKFNQTTWENNNQGPLPYTMTTDVVEHLDRETDEWIDEMAEANDEELPSMQEDWPHHLFKLSTFIELSMSIFMNGDRRRKDEHWSALVEPGEEPCITSEVVEDLHELVLNLCRRLIQSTLFLAQSRIRSSTNQYDVPPNEVKLEDVEAMRQVLNLEDTLWTYWVNLPRRAGFKVVSGSHHRDAGNRNPIPYEDVEAALSVKSYQGRRRSMSIGSASSHSSGSASTGSVEESGRSSSDSLYASDDSDVAQERLSREGFPEYGQTPPRHISLQPALEQPVDRGGRKKETEFEFEVEDIGETEDEDGSNTSDGSLHLGPDDEPDYAKEKDPRMPPRKRRRML